MTGMISCIVTCIIIVCLYIGEKEENNRLREKIEELKQELNRRR